MWCVPNLDDDYKRAMLDVLNIYEKPVHDQLPVVCLDEKSVELHDEKRPKSRDRNGNSRQDNEYKRCGTANIFVMSEPRVGRHFFRVTERRTRCDFAETLKFLEGKYPSAITIHLVMDNLNTHNEKSLVERFGEYEGRKLWARFTPHYTPKHASWLNQAEITINMFSRGCLGRRRLPSIERLTMETNAFFSYLNQAVWTIDWKWTSKRAKLWLKTYKFEH